MSSSSSSMSYNITNAETLCIQCKGWGKVPINQNDIRGLYTDCPTCRGELMIKSIQAADILGKCSQVKKT